MIFDILTVVVMLKNPAFTDVKPCHWDILKYCRAFLIRRWEVLGFKTSETTHPTTLHRIQGNPNIQHYLYCGFFLLGTFMHSTCFMHSMRSTLFPNWQKESWQNFEETSGHVRPEWVNKLPNSMTDIWWWWWNSENRLLALSCQSVYPSVRYSPTGRRNHGRTLKRLLDTWDRNGSTSVPTPWQIYDDDDAILKIDY